MHSSLQSLLEHMKEFETRIGYSFKDSQNLLLALTHSSYANENKAEKLKSNERLEFLGDAVLNIVISEMIYKKYSHLSEGEMTKARANIVCETSLMKCANEIDIGNYLLLGKGEELTGGRTRASILSDAFESLIGAIYLDGGMKSAGSFIRRIMKRLVSDSVNGVFFLDYKTQLQEIVQKNGEVRIAYEIVEEKGPDHNKLFKSQVRIGDRIMGAGEGKSKKEAEQNAAKSALQKQI